MSKADDIIRGFRERTSDEANERVGKYLKSGEASQEYVEAKSALNDPHSGLDKQAKQELKQLARESKKEMSSSDKTFAKMKLAKGGEGTPSKSVCFIATVVYGSINAPETEAIRSYRDNVLMRSNVGRKFIYLYYSGLGERIAYFIREKIPESIPAIKRCLDHLVERIEATKK